MVGWACGALVVLFSGLAAQRLLSAEPFWAAADTVVLLSYLGAAWLAHRLLVRRGIRGDEAIFPLAVLLGGIGLLVKLRLASTAPTWPLNWRLFTPVLGLVALALTVGLTAGRLSGLARISWLAGVAAPALLYLLLSRGTAYRGATYGPGLTTPSELLKPLTVIFLAGFLTGRRTPLEWVAFCGLEGCLVALLKRQNDLGMIAILAAVMLSLFFIATGRARYLLVGLATCTVLVGALHFAEPLGLSAGQAERRVDVWLNPWHDPLGKGYQTVQALFAIRAGGIDGAGLGRGTPQRTPLVDSDFVYAAVAEEFGLFGSLTVLLLYVALYRRGYRVAGLCHEPFRQRLATGCVTVLAIQTIINLGGVVRLLPVTGITLPFISHGGTSLLVSFALVGLVLSVGHEVELDVAGGAAEPRSEPMDAGWDAPPASRRRQQG